MSFHKQDALLFLPLDLVTIYMYCISILQFSFLLLQIWHNNVDVAN